MTTSAFFRDLYETTKGVEQRFNVCTYELLISLGEMRLEKEEMRLEKIMLAAINKFNTKQP